MRTLRGFFLMLAMTVLFACGGGGGGGGGGTTPSTPDNPIPNEPPAPSLTQSQANEILYAAYAGIGYNRANPAAEAEDDEALYGIMLDDLNSLMGTMVSNALEDLENDTESSYEVGAGDNRRKAKKWEAMLAKATLSDPDPEILRWSDPGKVEVTLAVVSKNANISTQTVDFEAKLIVNFMGVGYKFKADLITYNGDATGDELVTDATGTVKFSMGSGAGSNITIEPEFHSIVVTANKSLTADYADIAKLVHYQGWTIAYAVEKTLVNIWIAPQFGQDVSNTVDNRMYILKGAFKVGNDPYAFDMKYGQFHPSKDSLQKYIVMKGTVGVPGLLDNGIPIPVSVSSPGSEILAGDIKTFKPATIANAIARVENELQPGIWTGGELKIASNVPVTSSFSLGQTLFGTATLKFDGGDSWSVDNWQDELDPYRIEPK